MQAFDVAPFALPNTPSGEIRFEDPHDVLRVVVRFNSRTPQRIALEYLHKTWPRIHQRPDEDRDLTNPFFFGWEPIDDWFNATWRRAMTCTRRLDARTVEITFRPLREEFSEDTDGERYNVDYRRTLGVRVVAGGTIQRVQVFTTSPPARSRLRIELDAGRRTPGASIQLSAHNARVGTVRCLRGVDARGRTVRLGRAKQRAFELAASHMQPAWRYSYDDGHVTFALERETFTISLRSLSEQGPIWFAEAGVYVAWADDPTTFAEYRRRIRGTKTVAEQVAAQPEQQLGVTYYGQPRPHAVGYSIGCKHARQRFWIEPCGDIVLTKLNVTRVPGPDTPRYANPSDARFYFGLEHWLPLARHPDPVPVPAYNMRCRHDDVEVEQQSFAVPLDPSRIDGELNGDESIIAMVRFRLRNVGDATTTAELPVRYSPDSQRQYFSTGYTPDKPAYMVPPPRKVDRLKLSGGRLAAQRRGRSVLRAMVDTSARSAQRGSDVVFRQQLAPGETCDVVLKIPLIALDQPDELAAMRALDFNRAKRRVARFWQRDAKRGAQLHTPEPRLNDLHAMHATHVAITDFAMPDDRRLINTSVGASTYGNFTNESCMIVEELDQRGRHDEARRRIETWLKYQGTVGLLGRFTDHDGVFYGAGGAESGQSYCQHHSWVLWIIGRHFAFTGDRAWLKSVAGQLIDGMEWVFRQRRATLKKQPFSRGWERGFLPAGGLEDVDDYFYWLSTNVLTWRGCDTAAGALEAIDHPEARRLRREADAFGRDVRRGFDVARQQSPLVRLRDGRWVPTYPSRLYRRGRDQGWIREVLEGSVYLLLSGLIGPKDRAAKWILDDFHDNRYMNPPYGYALLDPEAEWWSRGGLSIQPNLLAGLMPHLDRDEIEVYLWMFFNCWVACWRDEIGAMVEHPMPVLGYSNAAHFKTSDQANAVKWLRYMFVYDHPDGTLHLGRALPRKWFAQGDPIWAERVATPYGTVDVRYQPEASAKRVTATVNLKLREQPRRTLVRFRHPEAKAIRSVRVNGKAHRAFDAKSGDVDVTARSGRLTIEVRY